MFQPAKTAVGEDKASIITPLIGILGLGANPTDIARDKREIVEEAFHDLFQAKLSQRKPEKNESACKPDSVGTVSGPR